MSLTNNVLEFRPGDKVIQIFPVARPLVGVVVGANKVEGKVYVTWNGRVMQVDPEEIQLACGSNFFGMSRMASKDSEKQIQKIATALSKSGLPTDGAKFHSKFEKNLIAEGIAKEDADDIAHEYEDAYKKRACMNMIDPLPPMAGEPVVVLNNGGSKPGYLGVLVGSEGCNAVVDISSGWSPVSNGCRLVQVPFASVAPVSTPTREAAEKQYPGSTVAKRKTAKDEEKRIAARAFDLFMYGVKNIDVFNNEDFKAWVQTTNTPDGNIVVSAVVERGGCQDPLLERYPIFEQKLCGFKIQNQTDYRNAVQRIKPMIDDCTSAIMQYFRNDIIPEFVNVQVQESVNKDIGKCAAISSNKIPPQEAIFGKDPESAYKRLKEIHSNNEEVHQDVIDFLEDKVARSDSKSLDYGLIVLGGRFPKGEKQIQKNPRMAFIYAKALLGKGIAVTQGILNAVAQEPKDKVEKLMQDYGLYFDDKGILRSPKEEPKAVAAMDFSTTDEALQYLSDITGKIVKVAKED